MACTSLGPVIYSDSPWVAGGLPIQYNIKSSKWPVNTYDSEASFTSVQNNNGFCQIVTIAASDYLALQSVKIDGSLRINGVWRVKSVDSSTTVTIDAPYQGDDIGTIQNYYENYEIIVEVWTGRYTDSVDTFAKVAQKRVKPNSSGTAIVDISDVVRSKLGYIENNLCSAIENNGSGIVANDLGMWTSFYIRVAESFDYSNGNSISPFVTEFVTDTDEADNINRGFATHATHQMQHQDGRSMGAYDIGQVDVGEPKAKFLTLVDEPTYFVGYEFDLQILSSLQDTTGSTVEYYLREYDVNHVVLDTNQGAIPNEWEGVYRFSFDDYVFHQDTDYFLFWIQIDSLVVSETKKILLRNPSCTKGTPVYLRWFNHLGGWEGFLFTANKRFSVNVSKRHIAKRNIYGSWDNNFKTATTERYVTRVEAGEYILCQSQFLTAAYREAMKWLILSPEVRYFFEGGTGGCLENKQKTVLVEDTNFDYIDDAQKLHELAFQLSLTDDTRVPRQ